MDYKKKYEQALERAKKWASQPTVWSSDDICQKIFPELAEGEDERIRKELIDFFKSRGYNCSKRFIAWLEKQRKVNHTCRNCQTFQDLHQNCPYSPIYQYTDLKEAHKHLDDETNCEFWNKKQGEQKPTWSEEDMETIDRIYNFIWKNRKGDTSEIYQQEKDANWLKSLKERMKIE